MEGGVGQHHIAAPACSSGVDPRIHHAEHAALHNDPHKLGIASPTLVVLGEDENGNGQAATMSDADGGPQAQTTRWMLGKIVGIAVPTIVSNVMWFSIFTVMQAFVGQRLGASGLAQISIGISVFNLMGLATGMGMCSALDTLVAQAFGRDPESAEMGELLQRGIVVNMFMAVPITIAFQTTGPLLRVVFGEDLGAAAHTFLAAATPMLIPALHVQAFSKALLAINIPEIPMLANVVGAVCNPLFQYWLTDSITGAARASAMTFFTMLVVLAVGSAVHPRVTFRRAKVPAPGLMRASAMKEYLAIGFPSLASLCAEWWAFELLQVVAANVSEHAVAVFSVALSIAVFAFSSPLGISVATCVTIGNALGANQPRLAKRFAKLGFQVDAIVTFFVATLVFTQTKHIAKIYTSDEKVQADVASISWLIALFHCGDSTQFMLQGCFRGAGKQSQAAKAVIFSLWMIGVPMPYLLAIHFGYGVIGIMVGLMCGFLVEIPLMAGMMLRWDWPQIALVAARLEVEEARRVFEHIMQMEDARNAEVEGDGEELPAIAA